MKKINPIALLPLAVFLILYLMLGILFEYILKLPMGFYNIPIVVAFLVSLLTACLQNRSLSLDQKLDYMAKGAGDKTIITMFLIFLTAGIFVGVTGKNSAESVAFLMLSVTPPKFAVAVLFLIASFLSIAMGTSCATITLVVPIAVAVSSASGFSLPLCIGSVIGGAMFGDNLSFISDTTIAACSTQGCKMKDKFKTNLRTALPAAIATLLLILFFSFQTETTVKIPQTPNLIPLLPYLLVLAGSIAGFHVFFVLLTGIFSAAVIHLLSGQLNWISFMKAMGDGASEMFETIIVTLLVAMICALVREYGGFETLLFFIRRFFHGKKGGLLGIGLLVGLMDIATANNTVAIVMSAPVSREISREYGLSPKQTASVLDSFSCVFQSFLPYGAQMLLALSSASALGYPVSASAIFPFLLYPVFLFLFTLLVIFLEK